MTQTGLLDDCFYFRINAVQQNISNVLGMYSFVFSIGRNESAFSIINRTLVCCISVFSCA